MSAKQEAVARLLFQTILFISAVTLALWEFRHKTDPQPVRFAAAEAGLKAGKPEAARTDFDATLKSRPDDPVVYTDIMMTCETVAGSVGSQEAKQKCWDLMIEYGTRAVEACKRQPAEDESTLYSMLGNAYMQVEPPHRQVQALAMSRRALDLQPHNSQIQNQYGYLLADNAVAKGPDVTEALTLLKEALSGLKNQSKFAITDPNYTIQLAETEDSYGWALYKEEQYPDAITTLTQALNDYPQGTQGELYKASFYHLGMAYEHNGQTDQARNAFRKALFYDPNYTDAKEGLKALDSAAASSAPLPSVPNVNPLPNRDDNSSPPSGPQNAVKSYRLPDKKK